MTSDPSSDPATQSTTARRTFPRLLAAVGGAAAIVWLCTCFVFVDESEVVLIERLGTIVAVLDQPEDRGLNVKLPWPIGNARRFDRRIQLFDPLGREVFTRDKKNVTVDAYVCWRIAESAVKADSIDRPAVRFFRSLGSTASAQARLETRVRSTLASRIAAVELSDLMRVTDPESPPGADADVSLSSIASQLLTDLRQRPDEQQSVTERLGIEIVDVRIKRINFPLGNQQAVFERMRSERRKIADRYRGAGMARKTVIESQANRQSSEIISRAEAEAERIRGEAEAEALAILNEAHARDPDFYRTVRTLDTYRTVLNEKTTLVLSASSNLLKLLVEGIPDLPPPDQQPGPLPDTDARPVQPVGAETDDEPAEATDAS